MMAVSEDELAVAVRFEDTAHVSRKRPSAGSLLQVDVPLHHLEGIAKEVCVCVSLDVAGAGQDDARGFGYLFAGRCRFDH
jgi:hypothetical protein